MNYKNIVKDFNWLKKYSGYPEKCGTLEPIIRKSIPKKPLFRENKTTKLPIEICPRCRDFVLYKRNYCSNCGQALDWSEYDK